MIWGGDDPFGRWVQGICGLILLAVSAIATYFAYQTRSNGYSSRTNDWVDGIAFGSAVLSVRCLWYAMTGKGNVNRDDFE